jgi:hypothetical protein
MIFNVCSFKFDYLIKNKQSCPRTKGRCYSPFDKIGITPKRNAKNVIKVHNTSLFYYIFTIYYGAFETLY